jgi:flavodoxin I
MNILLIYATNSGGTQMAAQTVTDILTRGGQTVTLKQVKEANPEDLTGYDIIIFGSPSWDYKEEQGLPHEDYLSFIEKMKGKKFTSQKFAVFGLGDSSYTNFCGAVGHLETMVKSVEGKLAVESLKIDGFFYDQAGNEQKIKDWAGKLTK